MKNLLSIQKLTTKQIEKIVLLGEELKKNRAQSPQVLAGQYWALIFSKASTRTRVSFEVGIRELGGSVMFMSGADMQLGRGEPVKDTARVLGRMIHGAVIRTFAQKDVEEFAEYSGIPTINALTDDEHPCQIIADLLTIRQRLGGWGGRRICFLGDGDCNVARSWIWAAERLGLELVIGAPKGFQPPAALLKRVRGGRVRIEENPLEAVKDADVVYTDVWVSMGKEQESADRMAALAPYQIDEALMAAAKKKAIVMHCLPAYRGKEITEDVMERHAEVIFDQAENRLHAQKAIMVMMAGAKT